MKLKALVIADTSPEIDLVKTIEDNDIDIFISLGDLYPIDFEGLDLVDHILKIGVYGNHDIIKYYAELRHRESASKGF